MRKYEPCSVFDTRWSKDRIEKKIESCGQNPVGVAAIF